MNRFTAMLTTMAFLASASMEAQTVVITRGGSRPVAARTAASTLEPAAAHDRTVGSIAAKDRARPCDAH